MPDAKDVMVKKINLVPVPVMLVIYIERGNTP